MKIYHNPRCTTSCKTLELLKSMGENPEIVEYLKNPPSTDEIMELVKFLKIRPIELIRQKENIFIENYKDKNFTDEEWITILAQNPKLIQRPIVVCGSKAVLGRPPQNVLKLFENKD